MHHIRNTLPEIKAKISQGLLKYQTELQQLGETLGEDTSSQANLILNVITEFCNEFRTIIDGTSADLSSTELSGGARISYVYHEIFRDAIKAMDPFDQIKDIDIRTILYNSSVSLELCEHTMSILRQVTDFSSFPLFTSRAPNQPFS